MTRGLLRRLGAGAAASVLIPAWSAVTAHAATSTSTSTAHAHAHAASPAPAAAAHGRISTTVGGAGGPGLATGVSVDPCALKYVSGELYFSSYQAVVDRVSQRTGLLSPVAGTGASSFGLPGPGDGVPAAAATLPSACGVTVDGAGNVLVADDTQVLAVAAKTGTFYRKRMTAGRVYTVVSGLTSVTGSNGAIPGAAVDVQLDASGNLVIAATGTQASHTDPEGDSRILVYAEHTGTFYGKKMATGRLYVIGGSLDGYTLGNAVPATRADLGYSIGTLRLDSAGNVVVADSGGLDGGGPDATGPPVQPQVRVIADRAGTFYGQRMKAGYIYTIAGDGTMTGDGVPATKAELPGAAGVALDHAGNVLVAAGAVRVIAARTGVFYGRPMTAGAIYTLPGFASAGNDAMGVAVDSAGNVLVARSAWWDVRMLAGKTGPYYGKSVRAGRVYSIAGNGRLRYSGDGGPATGAELAPAAVATFRSADMTAVADQDASVVRVVPGRTGVYFGRSMRAGLIYTIAGTGAAGRSGDGGPGTRTALDQPDSVAFDPGGDVLISDWFSHRVRVVAARTGTYYGQKMAAGHVYTVAGGGSDELADGIPARDARFEGPSAVATDPAGNVLIIDDSGAATPTRARVVAARTGTFYGQAMTAGDIYTVAGGGTRTGDGGPATEAAIESRGIAADGNGNMVLADQARARVVAGRTGTFYGQAMTAGDIYTVAGGGTQTGDGTVATKANLGLAVLQVAVDPAGNLLLGGGSTVFMVAERAGGYYGKAMRAGDVYTVALAAPSWLPLGDGGPAIGAVFDVAGIAVAPGTATGTAPGTGSLLIADDFTDRVRLVSR